MTRVDVSLPEPLAELLGTAVDEGLFKGPSDAARVATRAYFDAADDDRIAAVSALVGAADDEQATLPLVDVVRLSGRPLGDLPPEIYEHYQLPATGTEEAGNETTDSDP